MERISAMTPEERLARAGELSTAVRRVFLANLRREDPGMPEREMLRRLAEAMYGAELAAWAYGPGNRG